MVGTTTAPAPGPFGPVDVDWHRRFRFGGPRRLPIIGICIHTTENRPGTTAETVAAWQIREENGSYHRLVDSTGRILLANTDGWRTWSTANRGNDCLLHVSAVAWARMTRAEWLAQPAMLNGIARTLAHWSALHDIPLVKVTGADWRAGKRGVGGHADARDAWGRTTHWDPGAGFPYDIVLERAARIRAGHPAPTTPPRKETPHMTPVEKVLPYSRRQITQDTFYWCGPASAQTILQACTGRMIPERQLAREMGTTRNGTDHISQVARVLNAHAAGRWRVVEMPQDPPTTAQRETFWRHLVASIDAGYGVELNICSPRSNRPRPSYTSTQALRYRGGTIWHYVAAMGYAVDARGGRHVWWADSGFAPYGSWLTLEQTASLIPPKGYAWATAGPKPAATESKKETSMTPNASLDNQVQLRGPGMEGWDVPALLEARGKRKGDRGTLVELVAAALDTARDTQVQLRGPGLGGWSVPDLHAAQGLRDGDRGTVPELLATILTEVRALRADVTALKAVDTAAPGGSSRVEQALTTAVNDAKETTK